MLTVGTSQLAVLFPVVHLAVGGVPVLDDLEPLVDLAAKLGAAGDARL